METKIKAMELKNKPSKSLDHYYNPDTDTFMRWDYDKRKYIRYENENVSLKLIIIGTFLIIASFLIGLILF